MPLAGMVCHPRDSIATINLSIKFDVSNSTHYEDTKFNNNNENGVLCIRGGSLKVTEIIAIR